MATGFTTGLRRPVSGYAGVLKRAGRHDETGRPTGATVTLMLARVEGVARLWQTQPEVLIAALPWLRATTTHMVALNDGVLRSGPNRCDGFVATFGRPSDAVSCALDLQLSPLDPFLLSIGVHSVESEAARLRDIAHPGQTLVGATTAPWVGDRLPAGATLKVRQDGLFELCHAGLPRQFEPATPMA